MDTLNTTPMTRGPDIEGRSLVMGISVFGHDSSCALVDAGSGRILYALTEERFSNVKHDGAFPAASISLLTEKAALEGLGKITHVAFNVDPGIGTGRLKAELFKSLDTESADLLWQELQKSLAFTDVLHPDYFPLNYLHTLLSKRGVAPALVAHVSGKIMWYGNFALRHRRLTSLVQARFPDAEMVPVGHHHCHAASAFYCSPFEAAAVLTVDGQGEDETISLSIAGPNGIQRLSQTTWPNSLGALYMQIAWYLGFDGDPRYPGFGDEYKVMGMAAYGKPVHAGIFREMGSVSEQGEFELAFGKYLELCPVAGCAGHSQAKMTERFFAELGRRRLSSEPIEQRHYDVARSAQLFLEEIGVAIARQLKVLCPNTDNLCIAGGVGLNGLMNMKILQEAGFKRIFVQPAAGDDGTSLGAALHVYHGLLKGKERHTLSNAFLGLDYDEASIRSVLQKYNLSYQEPESLHREIGRLLQQGNIIARYVGRGEFGPRALGHRSILANPTLPEMKDAVNARVKHRESFRPFAPACLEERAPEFFDIGIAAPYMLLICEARPGVNAKIPAVVHDDGTARLQTVRQDDNADLHGVISAFSELSGIPIVLNTSFNVNGEAIVETPQDAVESFMFMRIDYLAIGPYLVSKAQNEAKYPRRTREEHIRTRQDRYVDRFFSREMYIWSSANRVETDLTLLKSQVELYKSAAEDRLKVIEELKQTCDERLVLINTLAGKHA